MAKSKRTARQEIERAMHVSFKLPEQAAALLDAYRDQVLAEAAVLVRNHRGDLNSVNPWWDTRDRDTAANLLLNARLEG